jgi:hypothetical protein
MIFINETQKTDSCTCQAVGRHRAERTNPDNGNPRIAESVLTGFAQTGECNLSDVTLHGTEERNQGRGECQDGKMVEESVFCDLKSSFLAHDPIIV